MSGVATQVPEDWRQLFAGRNVVFASLPPAPPRATSRFGKIAFRTAVLLVVIGAAIGAGFGIAAASGRWWIGLIVFLIIAWVATLLAIGMVGAVKVEREAAARRRARALEDPIGKLLPDRGRSRKAYRDPASYAALFALDPRPAALFDTELFDVVQREKFAKSLAPRGRLPEPEVLETSSVPAGICFLGFVLIVQSMQFWMTALASLRAGAPLAWSSYPGIAMAAIGVYLIVRDPWIRRRLRLPRFFGSDAVIGAGWIRDGRGELWTVEDSVLLVTLASGSMEVRLIKRTKVWSFYLPVLTGKRGKGRLKPGPGLTGLRLRSRAAGVAVDAAKGAAESVGVDVGEDAEAEMPTSSEPLRLLLSSWTYPEPRVDLAMRE